MTTPATGARPPAGPPPARPPGATLWLTGLPSAGKTTLARALCARLHGGRPVELLDGDALRAELSPDLGFTRADRDQQVRRVGFLARRLAAHGVLAVVPVVAPYADARRLVRRAHRADGVRYLEVHVATSLAACEERDVKGLYARARAGRSTGMTGLDAPYEAPEGPELRLETEARTPDACVDDLLDLLTREGLV
ncbi:adenylyl-sulfate kinase [Kitasatospora sp. NPDC049258]|uniref:adenylyl-sulfate kinase n=1 Tax=Kitasatospora sp. NPDC049258 TaxID=3155394 RepID=UPI003415B59A